MLALDLLLDLVILAGAAAWLAVAILRQTGRLGVQRGDGLDHACRCRGMTEGHHQSTLHQPDDTHARTR